MIACLIFLASCLSFKEECKTLTAKDEKNITYIVDTLAHSKPLNLLSHKKDLEIAGAKLDHVSPLIFIWYILDQEDLCYDLKEIYGHNGNSRKWKNFIGSEFTKNMNAHYDCVKSQINDFASNLNIDPKPLIEELEKDHTVALNNESSHPYQSFVLTAMNERLDYLESKGHKKAH